MSEFTLVVGAGPTGLAAAWRLAEAGRKVVVVERTEETGGYAGAHQVGRHRVHLGSHRIHPGIEPHLLTLLRDLLGEDLLERPRRGMMHVAGRWARFPLKFGNALRDLPPSLLVRFAAGYAKEFARREAGPAGSFEEAVRRRFGQAVLDMVYADAATKIWGEPPRDISALAADSRVRTKNLLALIDSAIRRPTKSFFYPRSGFHQITKELRRRCVEGGVDFWQPAEVVEVSVSKGHRKSVTVRMADGVKREECDRVVMTIPFLPAAKLLGLEAMAGTFREVSRTRGLVLVYLVLRTDQFSEVDTYYFPSLTVPYSRISEQRNFSPGSIADGETVLCAEIPCGVGDSTWQLEDEELGQWVCTSAERLGLKISKLVAHVSVKRIEHAYPVYLAGHERWRNSLLEWIGQEREVILTGRHPLFLQIGTHHAIDMGLAAADHIVNGGGGAEWSREVERFFQYQTID